MERNQFTFYKSFYFGLKNLKKRDRFAIYDAIISYGLFGKVEAGLTELQQGIFDLIKPNLDASAKKAAQAIKSVSKKESKKKIELETEIESEIELETETQTKGEGESQGGGVSVCDQKELFLSFWEKYPNTLDKEEAFLEWVQIDPDQEVCQQILAGLATWKKSARWQMDGGRFVPTAANFLKRGYWNVKPPKSGMDKKGNPSCTLGAVELENIRRLMEQ